MRPSLIVAIELQRATSSKRRHSDLNFKGKEVNVPSNVARLISSIFIAIQY